jgi:hypothetical protein
MDFYTEGDNLYAIFNGNRINFPYISANTYNKYRSSSTFMKTLQNAVNSLSARLNNERNSIIKLSGKTKPVTVKGRGTYNVPLEVFNKIIEASKVAGIDPKQGLAIAIKESSGYTDKNRINRYYTGTLPNHRYSYNNIENGAGPSTIVSNWQFFDNNPYIGLLKGWENSGWDVNRVEQDA